MQIEAQNRKRDKENLEKERIGSGGCKYKAEELNLELVRNCGKIKDLLEMIRAMELKFFLESDWRWKVLMEDEITDGDTLARRKEHFVKFLLMTYVPAEREQSASEAAETRSEHISFPRERPGTCLFRVKSALLPLLTLVCPRS